jgi:hypothetical protein
VHLLYVGEYLLSIHTELRQRSGRSHIYLYMV